MIVVYTQKEQGTAWLQRYKGTQPVFACVLGFTETGLIPGISAAGATPSDRLYTSVADAEFLHNGPQQDPTYPLPPLTAGASPVLISRAIVEAQHLPVYIFNAGLPVSPSVPTIDLGGKSAQCLTTGQALPLEIVEHLFKQGWVWGEKQAAEAENSYVILSECVVGGTTTALAVLLGLGVAAADKVNSSHPQCNHAQKLAIATTGLEQAVQNRQDAYSTILGIVGARSPRPEVSKIQNPLKLIAAVGDPMQIVVAGMTISASRQVGVLLAGGTQMLAVYKLAEAIATEYSLSWQPQNVVVGTTRWVAEDPTGDTVGLAEAVGSVPLLATQLSFANSRYPQLQAYERGFVKEGVGAGGAAIAAHLSAGWSQSELLAVIEGLVERVQAIQNLSSSEGLEDRS